MIWLVFATHHFLSPWSPPTESATFDVYSLAQETEADALTAAFTERGFRTERQMHFGGVWRATVYVDPLQRPAFGATLEDLCMCIVGKSLLPASFIPADECER